MRKLRDRALFAYLWVLAFILDRREPARYCPMCGSAFHLIPVDVVADRTQRRRSPLCGLLRASSPVGESEATVTGQVKGPCSRPSCSRQKWIGDACEPHWEHMRRNGLAGLVDSGPARAHLAAMYAAEFTVADISTLSDVSITCIRRQSAGEPRRIRAAESLRILAVPLDAELPHRIHFTIDATGFIRRIQAMCRMGWSMPLIAEKAGVGKRALTDAVFHQRVSRALFRAIDRVYLDLGYRQGPSKQAATKAQKKGWATAMAWDDNIDDPAAVPDVGSGKKRIGVPIEEFVHLREFGWSNTRIAGRFGVSEYQVRTRLKAAA